MIKAILCTDLAGGIGKDNKLLFHMKEDMDFFKKQTTNNVVLMGYNTFLSLGSKPLLNRINIVLSDKEINTDEDIIVVDNLMDAIDFYRENFCGLINKDLFIIGGASVYKQVLERNLVDEVLLTIIYDIKESDARVDLSLITDNFNRTEEITGFINEDGTQALILKFYN